MARKEVWILGLGGLLFVAADARADFTYTETVGDLAASVTFSRDANDLLVTLENIATVGVKVPTDVLTGFFFNLDGVTLTPLSAVLALGTDEVLFADQAAVKNPPDPDTDDDGLDSNGELGGEWAYRDDLNPADVLSGATHVIGSSGFGDFLGRHDTFPGDNLDDPANPDGLNYGIVGRVGGVDMVNGNAHVTGSLPLIRGGVTFRFSGLTPTSVIDETTVGDVQFNYGTDVSQPIPVPGAVFLAVAGFGTVACFRRRFH